MKKSSEKSFGILFGVILLSIFLWYLLLQNNLKIWFLILSILFFAISFFKPILFKPLNNIWIKFGELLGMIIAPIVMAIVYFFILTPISFIVRLFGKDLIGLNFIGSKDSYWIKRKKGLNSMRKQY